MQRKSYFVIVDYNLSRIDEVKTLVDIIRLQYDLNVILIRGNPGPVDYDIADVLVPVSPREDQFIEKSLEALSPYKNRLKAGLVFSDDAVHKGAVLLNVLGLSVDCPKKAVNAFSKFAYRRAERELMRKGPNSWLFCPDFIKINSQRDLEKFFALHPEGIIVKPTSEGNNRGVYFLESPQDVVPTYLKMQSHLEKGVIAESKIPFSREYSFDGVGHLHFITEKLSLPGTYPVEWGQILPARLARDVADAIEQAGRLANQLVGQAQGPFHNEIRVSDNAERCAVVEPNRRPAGMQIWRLAERVYGMKLYQHWIHSALGLLEDNELSMEVSDPQGQGGVLMLPATQEGILFYTPESRHQVIKILDRIMDLNFPEMKKNYEWFHCSWVQESGNYVSRTVKHNGEFIVQVGIFTPTFTVPISKILEILYQEWRSEGLVL